jgi:hypothetical protein
MRYLLVGLVVLGFIAVVPSANAFLQLMHGNSEFWVYQDYTSGQWEVDGVSHLNQQGFWFGDAVQEYRLGDWFLSETLLAPNAGVVRYQTPNFYAEIAYTLYGGSAGSGMSDVAESIYIRNTSGSHLDLRFFQYSDFNLGGSTDDVVWFPNVNAVRQRDRAGSITLSETVVTPSPNRWEGGLFSYTRDLLDDNAYYDLNNTPGIGGPGMYGDATWAFQWNRGLSADGTFIASKDKHLSAIPEPGTLLLLGLGLVGAAGIARWRRKKSV